MLPLVPQIWSLLSRRERLKLPLLLCMMVLGAFMELAGIGLVMPVIALLAEPALIEQNRLLHGLRSLSGAVSDRQFLLALCVALGVVYVCKNLFLLALTRFQAAFVFSKTAEIGSELFKRYLAAPYAFHLQRNSASFMKNINDVGVLAFGLLMPSMMLATELVVIAAIFGAMLLLAPLLTVSLAALSALLAGALWLSMASFNSSIGARVNAHRLEVTRDVMQTFEGVKECKLLNCEAFFSALHSSHQRLLRKAEADQYFAGQLPRFSIEAFIVAAGMGALAMLILCEVATGSIILRLSFIAVAMARMMPSLSRVSYYLATIRHSSPAWNAIVQDFDALRPAASPSAQPAPLGFNASIRLENVSFGYEGSASEVLNGFNVEIPRNSSIAFVGPTGCGKTTLMDIVLGLLKPSSGRVLVDGRDIEESLASWQTRIGYVPQSIFLMDDSIKANVAFGVPKGEIDGAQVRKCLETAQLWDFVCSLPEGVETAVGERGVRLSGGQRQRIGIARALYRNPEVLALDEATSALDNDTEKAFVDALKILQGKLTIIMIAHRLSTVEGCDQVISFAGKAHSERRMNLQLSLERASGR